MGPQIRWAQVGNEAHRAVKNTGHEQKERRTGDIFLLPDRYGQAKRANKTKMKVSKKCPRKPIEDSDNDASVLTDDTDDDTSRSNEYAEAEVRHLRKTRQLNDLFRRIMEYKSYLLKNQSGLYGPNIARTMSKAGKCSGILSPNPG